jgi:hypothetical protein
MQDTIYRVDGINENNQIHLVGSVKENPVFSHETLNGEKIYEFELECSRMSGCIDVLKCLIPEVFIKNVIKDKTLSFIGEIRTRNVGKHLEVRVFIIKEPVNADGVKHCNEVTLKCFICKEPLYRKTALGREISDALVAVNRPYSKSDYIPIICWGRNAMAISYYPVGTKLELKGRFQSREYKKKISENEYEDKIAYELSVSTLKQV